MQCSRILLHFSITGNDNLGSSPQSDGIKIYAINGWNDMDMSRYTGNSYGYYDCHPKMFCGDVYSYNCFTASDAWSCDASGPTTCNHIGAPTSAPTTKLTTLNPTTKEPTHVPTVFPTTSKPTGTV